MAMMTDSFGKIRGIASSYLSHPTMLRAKGVASQLARSPQVLAGAGAGAAIGAARGYSGDRRNGGSGIIGGIKGATVGALGGAAVGAGYRGYKSMGGYGGMKAAAMGGVARASRWGSGMMDRAASFINR